MVHLQRQQSCPTSSSQPHLVRRSISALPMGDDDVDIFKYRHQPVYKEHLSTSSVFSFHRVLLPLLYAVAMLNCGSSMRTKSRLTGLAATLLPQVEFYRRQNAEALLLLEEAKQKEVDVKNKYKELRATNMKLKHELRMKEEMDERQTDAVFEHLAYQHRTTARTWIDQRQTALVEKIENLQIYIKEQSRQYVLAEYGPGPHRVDFQVKLPHKSSTSKFVVELAPLDAMPHSLELFLDMISKGAWDNTAFTYHVNHAHVLAAAPVDFSSFERKDHHWKALGYRSLSFPEYSNDWPHEEYTIGFSGKGPNFYINAMDNSAHHGPGGQDHHELNRDADPCFGKVVWGKQVIQDMMPMKKETGIKEDPASWDDFDVTHIVKVRLQEGKNNRKI